MTTITNKTHRPLSISLPGGKKLRLGPLKSGNITPKAAEHPPVQALVEAGDVEITGGKGGASGAGSSKGIGPSSGAHGGGGVRHTGDR